MQKLVTTYGDMTGLNTRKSYKYNSGTAKTIGEADDLTSDAFTPEAPKNNTPTVARVAMTPLKMVVLYTSGAGLQD